MASSPPPQAPARPPRVLSPIYSPPDTPPPTEVKPSKQESALDQVHGLLRQLVRITVTDGRIFIGTFAGTDKPLNIILVNAEEFRLGPGQNPDGRYVGQIMVPWKIVVKLEANVPEKSTVADGMYIWQAD